MTSSGGSRITPQERLWAGDFGDAYSRRNTGDALVDNNRALFRSVLERTGDLPSVVEFGANVGNNLRALRDLLPGADLHAVEINEKAAGAIRAWGGATVDVASLLDFQPPRQFSLAFTKGVLIHLPPDRLPEVYAKLVQASSRYVLVCEYYNPTPVEVSYRGHSEALFKRDFAGEMLDAHPELRLVDYRFTYHRDPEHPLDDLTWFLLEKIGS
ncbi:pseudaminic acid biosynthesis-associated methylase [Oryzihumus leptocrescens]|uniref:Pseudaminic acid biosynthesis-associated methylase n=1 Tax=Oryzihumus leptocrescens TaxID=297536 RepID=A0A542ZG94_9MICO|nr:pseudaminic acid biosynthesis-associated methylase [Oryzihumus leptocrescens]TQL59352.1 pseudaminic acid biosynthesis-associated methylase [Oryzihumus leptocrescens]